MKKQTKQIITSLLIALSIVIILPMTTYASTEISNYLNLSGKKFASKLNLKKAPTSIFTSEDFGIYYSENGKGNTNFITIVNGCENKKGSFKIDIQKKTWTLFGVKIGMKRSKVYSKLTAKAKKYSNWNFRGSTSTHEEYSCSKWTMYVYYKSNTDKVDYIKYVPVKFTNEYNKYWNKRNS